MPDVNPQPMGAFPTTHWSLVACAGGGDIVSQRTALIQLLTRYMPALRLHLVARKRMDPHRAEDMLQGFLASKLIEQGIIERAERERGKFRTFLLTALDRFFVSETRKEKAHKRGGQSTVPLGEESDIAQVRGQPDDRFEVAWARELLAEAIRRTQDECKASGRQDVWGVFDTRVLGPLLHDAPPLGYEDLVKRFGLTSPSQASNLLVTGKRMFARILRSLVAEYAREDADIDEEIAELTEILSKARD